MCFRFPRSGSPASRLLAPGPRPTPTLTAADSHARLPRDRRQQGESDEEQLPKYSLHRPHGYKRVKHPEIYPKNAILSLEVKAALEALASPKPDSPAYISRLPSSPLRAKPFRDEEETKARELDLDRKSMIPRHSAGQNSKYREQMARRRYQRPWTLKEWRYVEKIQRGMSGEEMRTLVVRFRERFGWEPTEGQMRSQYWYFKLSDRRMRKFLEAWEK
ncbi:hypothetical protein BDZ45DRAFT_683166 [Acephala macrosclerotiorum]|nr:hypothetical protein BDZ45DRAFT_683166 [Acephala macrosclerotiorum]